MRIDRKAWHPDVDVYFQDNAWADTSFSVKWANETLKQFSYDMIVRLIKVIMALNDHNPDDCINTYFDNSNHEPYSPCKTISSTK